MKIVLIFLKSIFRSKTLLELKNNIKVFVFEYILYMPVIYSDRNDLKFVLYPGQNARIYFENKGNYEVFETLFCEKYIKPGMTIFDIGANIGMYSLPLSFLVKHNGKVHAFEAESKNYERLRINIALNNFTNIKLNHNAVFSESVEVTLNVFPDSVNSWHSLGSPELPDPFNPGKLISPKEKQVVQGVSIDDYVSNCKIEKIHFMKIDVEGAEFDVLKGASSSLEKGLIDVIMFEISLPQTKSMGHDYYKIFEYLNEKKMKIYSLSQIGELIPFHSNQKLEIYQNFIACNSSIIL
jgi:FkbM family methyltransferase